MFDFYTEVPQERTLPELSRPVGQQPIASLVSFRSRLGKLFSILLLSFISTAFLAGQAIGQTNVYLAPTAIGAGDGSNWDNARAGDAYFASGSFKAATINDTHIYIKAGTYTVNNNVNTYLGTNSTMQGGFPTSATGTDKTGYNPTNNATTINVTGPNFLSGTANPSSTVELKGIRFIGGGSVASGPLFYGPGSGGGGTPGTFKATDLYVSNFIVGGSPITLGSSGGGPTQSIFTNCVFNGNSAGLGGGAIWVGSLNTPITITGCSFTNNTARFNNSTGGGAVASFSDATITNSYFCNNTAETGGALSNASSSAPPVIWTITGCTFYSNSATALYGGALFAYAGAVHINSTNFYNNTAAVGGGAIYRGTNYFTDQTNNITNCIFYSNSVVGTPGTGSADGYGGGAIYISQPNADIPIYNCKFVNNSTVSNQRPGGAIYLNNFNTTGSKQVMLDQNTLFYGNTFGGSSTNLGADFIASNTGSSGIVKFKVSNTKVQLSAAASPPYTTFNANFGGYPWPYDFSGGGNTPNNTDNGGVAAFAGSCPSNITPVAINVTGQVWDDVNGSVTLDGSENGTNAGGPLYVNLVDGTGTVVASTTVSATGSYTLSAPTNTTGLKLVLTNTATSNTPGTLPSQWVNTGENVNGSNPATQSPTLGQIELTTGTTAITAQNFGIEHLPTPGSGANTVPNAGGTTPVITPASTFTNITPSKDTGDTPPGSVTAIRLTVFPGNVTSLTINGTVYTSIPVGGITVPTDGSGAPSVAILVDPTDDTQPVSFTYTAIDNAGKESTTTGTAVLNFTGIPDLSPVIYARPSTVYNTSPISVVVSVYELNGVATSGLITVKLNKDPKVSLSFNGGASTVGGRVVQNGMWSYDGLSDPDYYVLTTSSVIPAGSVRSFGLTGSLTPGSTSGTLTFSTVIGPGSGGEVLISNNTDADKIDFFQQ